MNRRKFLKTALIATASSALGWRIATSAEAEPLFERDFFAMGTEGRIKLKASNRQHAQVALDKAINRIKYIENKLTKFSPHSDIGRLNAFPEEAIYVSQDTLEVLRIGLQMSMQTSGRFDMGMGNFLSRPGLDEYVPQVGHTPLTIDDIKMPIVKIKERFIRLQRKNSMLDLGGIGKGYALDEAMNVLRKHEIHHAAIELGGDVITYGGKATGKPWKIERDPNAPIKHPTTKKLYLMTGSVASSGGYLKRALGQTGKIKHHIIDPLSFKSHDTHGLVTVIGHQASICDALATAYYNISLPEEHAKLQQAFPDHYLIES